MTTHHRDPRLHFHGDDTRPLRAGMFLAAVIVGVVAMISYALAATGTGAITVGLSKLILFLCGVIFAILLTFAIIVGKKRM